MELRYWLRLIVILAAFAFVANLQVKQGAAVSLSRNHRPTSVHTASVLARVRLLPGKTLSHIAFKYYGDARRWGIIAQANGITNTRAIPAYKLLIVPVLPLNKERPAEARIRTRTWIPRQGNRSRPRSAQLSKASRVPVFARPKPTVPAKVHARPSPVASPARPRPSPSLKNMHIPAFPAPKVLAPHAVYHTAPPAVRPAALPVAARPHRQPAPARKAPGHASPAPHLPVPVAHPRLFHPLSPLGAVTENVPAKRVTPFPKRVVSVEPSVVHRRNPFHSLEPVAVKPSPAKLPLPLPSTLAAIPSLPSPPPGSTLPVPPPLPVAPSSAATASPSIQMRFSGLVEAADEPATAIIEVKNGLQSDYLSVAVGDRVLLNYTVLKVNGKRIELLRRTDNYRLTLLLDQSVSLQP